MNCCLYHILERNRYKNSGEDRSHRKGSAAGSGRQDVLFLVVVFLLHWALLVVLVLLDNILGSEGIITANRSQYLFDEYDSCRIMQVGFIHQPPLRIPPM